jgi:signal transduction histidine kinase/ActR/RegA family two-component response regulator
MVGGLRGWGARFAEYTDFRARIVLLVVAFAFPIALLSHATWQDYRAKRVFTEREIAGSHALSPVLDLHFRLLRHSGTSKAPTVSSTSLSIQMICSELERARLGPKVDRAIADLASALVEGNGGSTPDPLLASRKLIAAIGDHSNLILDPDLDTYYLMYSVVVVGPNLADAIDDLTARHQQLSGPARTEARTRALSVADTKLRELSYGLERSLEETNERNLVEGLVKRVQSLERTLSKINARVEQDTDEPESYEYFQQELTHLVKLTNSALSVGLENRVERIDAAARATAINCSIALSFAMGMVVLILLTTTDKRKAESALSKSNEQLAIRNKELEAARDRAVELAGIKSQFLANMSHEIRTPLNGVLGLTRLLTDRDLDPESKQLARTTHKSASALIEVINNILDYSKLEAGKMILHTRQFDLRALVFEVAELCSHVSGDRPVSIVVDIDDYSPRLVIGDDAKIRQILTNLVGNALKFTEEGDVTISVWSTCSSDSETWIACSVADTGIGISGDHLGSIFESFTQADTSDGRRFGGTGLGLAICSQLCSLLGGDIRASSVLGQGSVFTVEIPLATVSNEASSVHRPLADQKVLILAPYRYDVDVLARDLRVMGCEVHQHSEVGARQSRLDHWNMVLIDEEYVADLDPSVLEQPVGCGFGILSRARTSADSFPNGENLMVIRSPLSADAIAQHMLEQYEEFSSCVEESDNAQHRFSILVVEDNEVNQLVTRRMLEKLGCVVTIAHHGKEAIELVSEWDYDAIFTDCQMPVMDGYELSRVIRSMPLAKKANTPIVAITASSSEEARARCLSAGMNSFVEKPVTPENLAAALEACRTIMQAAA